MKFKFKFKKYLPIILLLFILIICVIFINNRYFNYKFFNFEYFQDIKNYESFNNNSSIYTAIIVEPRKHKALEFVLLNACTNLDNNWSIIIFHGNLNKSYIQKIINTKLIEYKNRINLISLGVDNLTIAEYNVLFKTKELYDYIPTETFLVFQTDSMIIPRNNNKINDYLQYDYVGAVWPNMNNNIGNGGFSLRKKSKMLEIINKCPYTEKDSPENEDIYFSIGSCKKVDLNKPSVSKAMKFSSEGILDSESFGIHKCWGDNSIKEVLSNFPEVEELYNLQGVEN